MADRAALRLPALLASIGTLAVVLGAFALINQLRVNQRRQALEEARRLAFGLSREVGTTFARFREEFAFSLNSLPYARALDTDPGPLSSLRRFLALNRPLLRELMVADSDSDGYSLQLDDRNYFQRSPLGDRAPPFPSADNIVISGLVQGSNGGFQARVSAVLDPQALWSEALARFSGDHPGLWVTLLSPQGEPLLARHGAARLTAAPVIEKAMLARMLADAADRYEGRGRHVLSLDGNPRDFISAYTPVRIEDWSGILVVSVDEYSLLQPVRETGRVLAATALLLLLILLAMSLAWLRQIRRSRRLLDDGRLRLAAIFDTVQSGILLVDAGTGLVTEANPAALALLGRRVGEVLAHPLAAFLPEVSLVAGMNAGGESRLRSLDGDEIPVLATTADLELACRRYLLCSFVDITSLKRTENRLLRSEAGLRAANSSLQATLLIVEQAVREAEAANRAKSAFLAMMSHELRTPLNSILGLTESLLESVQGPVTAPQARYLRIVVTSGRHLLALINDILDLTKIESGREALVFEDCILGDLCQQAIQLVGPRPGQRVVCEIARPGLVFKADPRRVKQILVNLLANAVKFTPEGGRLGLRVGDDGTDLVFEVWDEGIGIAGDDFPKLFKPFQQLDTRLAREYPGTGLGLALVKQLVTMHRGTIAVASTVGTGTTFTFRLPLSGELS